MSQIIDSYKHKGLRNRLVAELKAKGISDTKVLEAIMRVPRHVFFENAFLDHAYQDKAFPIGEGQTISQPYTVAKQTELLQISQGDKVLEIGTGSGYQSCILMELDVKLYSIEVNKTLFEKTITKLHQMGYHGDFFCLDGSKGLPQYAPFDKILVTAGAPFIPGTFIEQLKIGGTLVIPVGDRQNQKMVRIVKKSSKELQKQEFGDYRFVPMLGEQGWKPS